MAICPGLSLSRAQPLLHLLLFLKSGRVAAAAQPAARPIAVILEKLGEGGKWGREEELLLILRFK